jgi:hypothetical protein
MKHYHFFLEYENRSVPVNFEKPDEDILATDVEAAIKRFAKRKNIRLNGWETLVNGGYRAYASTNKAEIIYYIEEEPGE